MVETCQGKDVEVPIKLQENDRPSKLIRVITVSAYVFSVSFAALMLSLYYIFFWDPERPEHSNKFEADEDLGIPQPLLSNNL